MPKTLRTSAAFAAAARGDYVNALVASTPGGIERQEAEGQARLTSTFTQLPKNIDRRVAEALGFKFGKEGRLFVDVVAPDGWELRPTDHSMHNDIVDNKGRTRGGVFYKAAFYDEKANGHWLTRYTVERDYPRDDAAPFDTYILDRATGERIEAETMPGRPQGRADLARYKAEDAVRDRMLARLAEQFPDWRNPLAYWD